MPSPKCKILTKILCIKHPAVLNVECIGLRPVVLNQVDFKFLKFGTQDDKTKRGQ